MVIWKFQRLAFQKKKFQRLWLHEKTTHNLHQKKKKNKRRKQYKRILVIVREGLDKFPNFQLLLPTHIKLIYSFLLLHLFFILFIKILSDTAWSHTCKKLFSFKLNFSLTRCGGRNYTWRMVSCSMPRISEILVCA